MTYINNYLNGNSGVVESVMKKCENVITPYLSQKLCIMRKIWNNINISECNLVNDMYAVKYIQE